MIKTDVDILKQITTDLRSGCLCYEHLLADMDAFNEQKVIYNFDFSLLYPYLFPSAESKHPQYESVGRNIFALLTAYHNNCGFRPVFSLPSLLELLDVLAHRIDRIESLISDRSRIKRISSDLKDIFKEDSDHDMIKKARIRSILINLRVSPGNGGLSKFFDMLNKNQIKTLLDYTDPGQFSHNEFKQTQEKILNKMSSVRSQDDGRDYEDRMFHYRVDTWNIAASLWSERISNIEIDHICRGAVSQFFPREKRSLYSRSPVVPLVRLYSLLRASPEGNIQTEAKAFTSLGYHDLNKAVRLIEHVTDIQKLTPVERDEIDRVYNQYLRPLFYDYSTDKGGILPDKAQELIKEMEMERYKSVLTEEGLRDRFLADADDIRNTAQRLVNQNPMIIEERLLTDYNLDNNPRVLAIRKRLEI